LRCGASARTAAELIVAFVDVLPGSAFDFDQAIPGPRARDLAYAAWLLGVDLRESREFWNRTADTPGADGRLGSP
jgi:hypothetical protein